MSKDPTVQKRENLKNLLKTLKENPNAIIVDYSMLDKTEPLKKQKTVFYAKLQLPGDKQPKTIYLELFNLIVHGAWINGDEGKSKTLSFYLKRAKPEDISIEAKVSSLNSEQIDRLAANLQDLKKAFEKAQSSADIADAIRSALLDVDKPSNELQKEIRAAVNKHADKGSVSAFKTEMTEVSAKLKGRHDRDKALHDKEVQQVVDDHNLNIEFLEHFARACRGIIGATTEVLQKRSAKDKDFKKFVTQLPRDESGSIKKFLFEKVADPDKADSVDMYVLKMSIETRGEKMIAGYYPYVKEKTADRKFNQGLVLVNHPKIIPDTEELIRKYVNKGSVVRFTSIQPNFSISNVGISISLKVNNETYIESGKPSKSGNRREEYMAKFRDGSDDEGDDFKFAKSSISEKDPDLIKAQSGSGDRRSEREMMEEMIAKAAAAAASTTSNTTAQPAPSAPPADEAEKPKEDVKSSKEPKEKDAAKEKEPKEKETVKEKDTPKELKEKDAAKEKDTTKEKEEPKEPKEKSKKKKKNESESDSGSESDSDSEKNKKKKKKEKAKKKKSESDDEASS